MNKYLISSLLLITAIIILQCIPDSSSYTSTQSGNNSFYSFDTLTKPLYENGDIPDAVQLVNYYRQASGLGPVEYDPYLDEGCLMHIEYMAINQSLVHYEESDKEGYTETGYQSAKESLLAASTKNMVEAVEMWINSLYHRFPLLDPNLKRIGGAYKDGYAALNVTAGKEDNLAFTSPVIFPAPLQLDVIPIFGWEEVPNPLPENISLPVGNFITITFPEHCKLSGFTTDSTKLYDERGNEIDIKLYLPDDPDDENSAYMDNSVALLPLYPMEFQSIYTVEVNGIVDNQAYNKVWSFQTL